MREERERGGERKERDGERGRRERRREEGGRRERRREEGERKERGGERKERGVINTHLRKVGSCCGVLLLKNYLTISPSGLSMVTLIPPNGRPLDMNLILSDVVRVVGPVQHTHVCAVIMVCIIF